MDSRHDSFLDLEDKRGSFGFTDAPSSPLSSVPEDFESQEVPQDLQDIAMPDSSVFQDSPRPSSVPSSALMDTIHVASPDRVLSESPTFVRRSERKRKAPAWFLSTTEADAASQSERPAAPERPVKQRRTQPKKAGKPRGKKATEVTTAPLSHINELPLSDEEVDEPISTTQQTNASRVVKIKVNPERLGQILGSAPPTPPTSSTAIPSPEPMPPVSTESEPTESEPTESEPTKLEPEIPLAVDQPTFEAVEHDLVALSLAVTNKVPIEQKPEPRGQPEIWAESRHHLCESLSGLYASWQGSYYGKNGVAKAFMLDGNGHARDHLDENVIVLRASGSMAKDGDNGMKQREDQEQKHQYHAMINAINQQSPVAVICGDKNTQVPSKMPHKYNSLGWYKVTHVWTERDRFNVIKYRLEKLDSTAGWWYPRDSEPVIELGALGSSIKQHCQSCSGEYDQVYLCGWMCLNSRCEQFWCLPGGGTPDAAQLIYDPRFLKQKTPWANEEAPLSFRFPLYITSAIAGEDYKAENLRGMTCPECGKCNARVKWEGWECTGCGFEHKPEITPLPAASIQDQNYPVTNAYPSSHDSALPHIKISVGFSHNYRWITYKFKVSATEEGEVVHGIANKVVREETGGPNEMWENLQTDCHGLVRRELSNALMNSFTINYGMPYKFIAAGDSLPFTDAPWPVTEAVSRLNWADRMTSGNAVEDQEKFNELYLVAYLQDQSMNYHDDGEKGLGSTVATLSLGGRADMGFKPKSPFYHGMKTISYKKKRMTVMTKDEPLPEFPNYDLRMRFLAEIRDANLSEDAEHERLAEMATALRAAYPSKKSHTKVDDYIKLSLGHGDIVIMRGAHLQKFYEHGVSPRGLMRYALTCRTVLPGHLKESELPDYEVDLVQNEYDGSRIAR
jgi:alkylated DNA repair dioxygenase AlkB